MTLASHEPRRPAMASAAGFLNRPERSDEPFLLVDAVDAVGSSAAASLARKRDGLENFLRTTGSDWLRCRDRSSVSSAS